MRFLKHLLPRELYGNYKLQQGIGMRNAILGAVLLYGMFAWAVLING